jgi:hypothetical protein
MKARVENMKGAGSLNGRRDDYVGRRETRLRVPKPRFRPCFGSKLWKTWIRELSIPDPAPEFCSEIRPNKVQPGGGPLLSACLFNSKAPKGLRNIITEVTEQRNPRHHPLGDSTVGWPVECDARLQINNINNSLKIHVDTRSSDLEDSDHPVI